VTGRFAACEISLRQGSLAADVALVRAAGVEAIGVTADIIDNEGVSEAKRILDGEGVQVSSYVGAGIILDGEGKVAPVDDTLRHIEAAAALRSPCALVITGPLDNLDARDADAMCREWLSLAAARAVDCGIRIMLEPIHPLMRHLTFVHTVEHGLALTDGIEGAGIVLDVGHVWWQRDINTLIADNIEHIVSVQLTNVDGAALADFRYQRTPLGTGDIPVASLIRMLEASGYRGWYEWEVIMRTPRDERLDLLRSEREWFESVTAP